MKPAGGAISFAERRARGRGGAPRDRQEEMAEEMQELEEEATELQERADELAAEIAELEAL